MHTSLHAGSRPSAGIARRGKGGRSPATQCQPVASTSGRAEGVPEAVISTRTYSLGSQWRADIAEASVAGAAPGVVASPPVVAAAAAAGLLVAGLAIKKVYDTPSRAYEQNVGDEYDAWTDEGILEYYWGEHIHLGYYTGGWVGWQRPRCRVGIAIGSLSPGRMGGDGLPSHRQAGRRAHLPASPPPSHADEELDGGWWKADFKANKLRFTEKMFEWSGASQPKRILDVGCGFGGSSRWMAATNPQAQVTGAPPFVEGG